MNTITTLACVSGVLLAASGVCGAPIRVLLVTGANNHDWKSTVPVLKTILEDTGRFQVTVTEAPHQLKPGDLDQYDVLFSHWNSWNKKDLEKQWSAELRTAYLDFVRKGKGHVVFHAGSSSFYDDPEFQALYGVTWELGKTGHGARHEFPVRLTAVEHPITRGLAEFRTHDELWHRPKLQPGATVLTEAFADGAKGGTGEWEPCAIVNPFGKGRNFTLLLGHGPENMRNEGFKALLARGTEWAAKGDVKSE